MLDDVYRMNRDLATAHHPTPRSPAISDDYYHRTTEGMAIDSLTRSIKIFHMRSWHKSKKNKIIARIDALKRKSPNVDTSMPYAIVDSGATVSVTPSRELIREFLTIRDSAVNIEGIVASADLKITGAGRFTNTLTDIKVLYAPGASETIVSWFDLKRHYKISLLDQDKSTEHLLLRHKKTRATLRAFIHPEIGLYVLPLLKPPAAPTKQSEPTTATTPQAIPTSPSTPSPAPAANLCHCHNKIFSLRDRIKLENLGHSKLSAARIARLQDIHEAYSFCGTKTMRDLIVQHRLQKSDPNITVQDWSNWVLYHCENCHPCSAGKTLRPDQISSTSRPSDTTGELVHVDLFYIKSDIDAGNLTVLIAVDEASGYISTHVLDDKTAPTITKALQEIIRTYAAGRSFIKEFRSDNEPCLIAAFEHIRASLGIKLSHSEEYRHTTRAERSIRKIIDPFTATIHSSIPIPAFLYPKLLDYVTDSVNNIFNSHNDAFTPHEQVHKGKLVDFGKRASTKFGQLVRTFNPKPQSTSYYSGGGGPSSAAHTEAASCVYGIIIGHDPDRPHCTIIYNFVDGGKISRANYTNVEWSDELQALYQAHVKHSITKHRPVFLDTNNTTIPDNYPNNLPMPTPTHTNNNLNNHNDMAISDSDADSDSDPDSDLDPDSENEDADWIDITGPPSDTFTHSTNNNNFHDLDPDTAFFPCYNLVVPQT